MAEQRFHKIRALQVDGGFLSGVSVEFDDHLNCIIGGRGTGKTTVLEFLRYALDAMPDAERPGYRDIRRLVSKNLESGRIRVRIETKDGLSYLVERTAHDAPEVLGEDETPTGISLAHGAIFDVDVYSQNEIESIAIDPRAQLALIDRFQPAELKAVNHEIQGRERELSANAAELAMLQQETESLEEALQELSGVEEKLRGLEGQGAAEADDVNREIALKGLRDREARTLESARTRIEGQRGQLREVREQVGDGHSSPPEIDGGPNAALFQELSGELAGTAQEVSELLLHAEARLEACLQSLASVRDRLDAAHREQEKGYRQLLDSQERDQDQARERVQLQRMRNELLQQKTRCQALDERIAEKTKLRQRLLRELSEQRDRRTAIRQEVVSSLNVKLKPLDVQVTLLQAGDASRFEEALERGLKGDRRQYRRYVEKIAGALGPGEFARLVGAREDVLLEEETGLRKDVVEWIVAKLRGTPLLRELEAVEMEDVVTVQLRDGEEWKDSTSLSTGQKCTTILPILLLESEKPLLIDQPEDNLDNAFIYDTVVTQIRQVMKTRQLIFVTHNPNIPVLGEAGRVVVMDSDGRRGRTEGAGTVDEVKDSIERILEGGEEAFLKRKERYGH